MEKAKKTKKINRIELALHLISVCILLGSLAFSVFYFKPIFFRTLQAIKDFGLSVAYYFTEPFGFEGLIKPTVNEIPDNAVEVLPFDPTIFKGQLGVFWERLIDKRNLRRFLIEVALKLLIFMTVLFPITLFILLVHYIKKSRKPKINNDHNADTRALRFYKKIEAATWDKVKVFYHLYVAFLEAYRSYIIAFVVIWVYNLNAVTIVLEALAYIFYLAVSFDFVHIYTQIAKLAMDLTVALDFVPWFLFAIVGWVLFNRWRQAIGIMILQAYEAQNREFLNTHPGALFLTGKQRAKKTTIITDMALSQDQIFRDMALEGMMKRDKQFPFFPWINVDLTLKRGQAVYGLPTLQRCRLLIQRLRVHFALQDRGYRSPIIQDILCRTYGYDFDDFIFGYDYKRYGLYYNDGLTKVSIFDAIEGYLQQCYIYTAPTSLIFGNYPVRTDLRWEDHGNLPRYDGDFFRRDPEELDELSQYSHIYDYDSGRLGKVMDKDNPLKDGFEFGVVTLDEIAKELGNQNTNAGKSAKDSKANVRNDGYLINTKMEGHSATIDNYTYIRRLMTDQRPDSLGAENKDLSDVVMIKDASKKKVVLPFYCVEKFLGWLVGKLHDERYLEQRMYRGDNTLPMYLLRKLTMPIFHHCERMTNIYSIYTARLKVWDSMTKELLNDDDKYYIATKKTYSGRFATDGIKDFYSKKAALSKYGLNDFPTFANVRMTTEEMDRMHSYFYSMLNEIFVKKEKGKEEKETGKVA